MCPRARGKQPQLHPKAEEPTQAYQPATQPQAAPPPPAQNRRDIRLGNPEQPSGLQSPRPPKPKAPNPMAAPKGVEVPTRQAAVWIRGRWS